MGGRPGTRVARRMGRCSCTRIGAGIALRRRGSCRTGIALCRRSSCGTGIGAGAGGSGGAGIGAGAGGSGRRNYTHLVQSRKDVDSRHCD